MNYLQAKLLTSKCPYQSSLTTGILGQVVVGHKSDIYINPYHSDMDSYCLNSKFLFLHYLDSLKSIIRRSLITFKRLDIWQD